MKVYKIIDGDGITCYLYKDKNNAERKTKELNKELDWEEFNVVEGELIG